LVTRLINYLRNLIFYNFLNYMII